MLIVGVQPLYFKAIRPTVALKVRLAVLRRNDLLDAPGFVLPIRKGDDRIRRRESGPQEASLKALNGPATIYDPAGRLVWTGTLNGHLPNLKSGIYFLRTASGVRRLVVR